MDIRREMFQTWVIDHIDRICTMVNEALGLPFDVVAKDDTGKGCAPLVCQFSSPGEQFVGDGADVPVSLLSQCPYALKLPFISFHGLRLDKRLVVQKLKELLHGLLGIFPIHDHAISRHGGEEDLDNPCRGTSEPVSYTHLRAHETRHDLVCRLLLEKKK